MAEPLVPDVYMVTVNPGGSTFVKDLTFFRSQGGFAEEWGQHWRPIIGYSLEDARERATMALDGAAPYQKRINRAHLTWNEAIEAAALVVETAEAIKHTPHDLAVAIRSLKRAR